MNATTITKFFYADGMQVAKMVGTGVYYVHEDALGSTRLVTTSTVTVTFSSNYVPYGNSYGTIGNEVFRYTGEPYDSATGLYLFGARFYDPLVGRFVTEDSYLGSNEDPKSRDRYVYAEDDPEKNRDPSGHRSDQCGGDCGADVTIIVVPTSTGNVVIIPQAQTGVLISSSTTTTTTTTSTTTTTASATTPGISATVIINSGQKSIVGALEVVPSDAWVEAGIGSLELAGGVVEVLLSGFAIITIGEIPVVDVAATYAIINGYMHVTNGMEEEFQGWYEIGLAIGNYYQGK